jgi:small subunit ribosomal protein S8
MVNDPIGDMLIQMKNAALVGNKVIELPHSRTKQEVADIFRREGYVTAIDVTGDRPKQILKITLRYRGKMPVITGVKRMSKPGLRVYITRRQIPRVVGGTGIAVLSTSRGIMTGKEAREKGLGGEFLCTMW